VTNAHKKTKNDTIVHRTSLTDQIINLLGKVISTFHMAMSM